MGGLSAVIPVLNWECFLATLLVHPDYDIWMISIRSCFFFINTELETGIGIQSENQRKRNVLFPLSQGTTLFEPF